MRGRRQRTEQTSILTDANSSTVFAIIIDTWDFDANYSSYLASFTPQHLPIRLSIQSFGKPSSENGTAGRCGLLYKAVSTSFAAVAVYSSTPPVSSPAASA